MSQLGADIKQTVEISAKTLGEFVDKFAIALNKNNMDEVKKGGSSSLFGLFTAMKFTVLATTLFAVFFLFGAPAIFISNSVLVFSLLSPSLFFAIQSSKGLSNEC